MSKNMVNGDKIYRVDIEWVKRQKSEVERLRTANNALTKELVKLREELKSVKKTLADEDRQLKTLYRESQKDQQS